MMERRDDDPQRIDTDRAWELVKHDPDWQMVRAQATSIINAMLVLHRIEQKHIESAEYISARHQTMSDSLFAEAERQHDAKMTLQKLLFVIGIDEEQFHAAVRDIKRERAMIAALKDAATGLD